VVRILLNPV